MNKLLPVLLIILAAALIAAATIHSSSLVPATTPEGAVRALLNQVKARDAVGAYQYVATASNTAPDDFKRDVFGQESNLRTYSSLQLFDTKVLREDDQEASVRANLEWASAVGAVRDTRDLKVVREDNSWKVIWPVQSRPKVPPQVIPVNYLRWDIVTRGLDDDWGAQNVDAPRVRIISMNPVEKDGDFILLGEIENEDTVPGFVSVAATLIGKDGQVIAQEESFDKISHVLLPKEISPFRIDFPNVSRDRIKSVHMQPNAMLVPASADPVMGVMHQALNKDARGHSVLKGELMNQSGQTVNIPHVLATFYDSAGKVIWVSDGYVDQSLAPMTPVAFSIGVRDDLASQIHSYRVTVNQYTRDRVQ
ncbi:MAG: hypothetical protein CXZ00_05725 [Acidobacteria bacterium]|mgnify:CR=1 FL=1|nr:MAG: hypothetical protein CXZ00_05725 [Acidobacteriota bacterium]